MNSVTTNQIRKQIDLNAPLDRVWNALTDYKEFGTWFGAKLESPFVEGEPTLGQNLHPGYEHVSFRIVIKDIKPQTLFSYYWHPYSVDTNVDYSHETPTLVEFTLEPLDNGTRLVVLESGFDNVPASRRDEAFRMHEKGWSAQLVNIERHVTTH